MAKDAYSDIVLFQQCHVDKATGKNVETSNSKIRLTKLPKPPEGMEIEQVEVFIHTRPNASKDGGS